MFVYSGPFGNGIRQFSTSNGGKKPPAGFMQRFKSMFFAQPEKTAKDSVVKKTYPEAGANTLK